MKATMSSTDRLLSCGHWLSKPWTRVTSEWSSKGNIVHLFLLNVSEMGAEAALRLVPLEFLDVCANIELDTLPAVDPDKWAGEVAFAYDWQKDACRELGRGKNRDYSGAEDSDFCGTADVVGINETEVIILDYKTGFGRLGGVGKLGQLRSYALAACRTYGRDQARVGTINPLTSKWETAVLTSEDLAAHSLALFNVFSAEVPIHGGEPHEGAWCQYCPAFDSCDAKRKLLLAAGGFDDLLVADLTNDVLVRAIEKLEMLKQATDRAWKLIRERASITPIQSPEGNTVWGPVKSKRESISAMAVPWLRENYSADLAMAAAEVKVTKDRLRNAMREHGRTIPGFVLSKAERACLGEMREAGLMDAEERVSYEWHVEADPVVSTSLLMPESAGELTAEEVKRTIEVFKGT